MSKHTPGPWKYWRNGKVIEVKAATGKMPVVPWTAFDDSARPLSVHDANARLIAAAPELLRACQLITAFFDKLQSENYVLWDELREISTPIGLDEVRAAIMKAEAMESNAARSPTGVPGAGRTMES